MSMKHLTQALGPIPQSQPLPGQVANSAGGYSFGVDDWGRLDRFLILGSEGGSFYAGEQKLTAENTKALRACIAKDGREVVKRVVAVSDAGRAPKNDPAIYALALCLAEGDALTKAAAREAIPKVCRIGTHILHLAAFYKAAGGGWGRGTKRAFARWFTAKPASELGYQMVKYQQRDGWATRDLLRLSHPASPTVDHATLFAWGTGKEVDTTLLPPVVEAYEQLKREPSAGLAIKYIRERNLPREAIPTQLMKDPNVWRALIPKMGLTALIRNLANLSRHGITPNGSEDASLVVSRITDAEALRKSRVHPLAVLEALKTYKGGRSLKGFGEAWVPNSRIVDALDAAFYASFGNVERTGKRFMLALDVSGSMSSTIAGSSLSAREASTAMAMVTAAVEPNTTIMCFSGGFIPCDLSPRRRLDDNINAVRWLGGATDCSVPFLHALKYREKYDAFVVYTDSETYAGISHPSACLKKYRQVMVPGAKSAVVGMVSNGFTLADPNDPGMLDVVGFDSATPNVLSSFFAG